MKKCHLWLTTEEIQPEKLKNATAVVIDVMLATTTLVTILERGARRIYPVESVYEAHSTKEFLGHPAVLTGGELGGKPVEGFDCAHLPDEYTPERVKDHDIVFLSSNGTRAITKAKPAKQLLLGNLRNAYTIAEYLNQIATEDVYIICAGSLGQMSLEDYVCASIILSRLNMENVRMNDAAVFALEHDYDKKEVIEELLAKGRVGRTFTKLGLDELFDFVTDVGLSTSVVELYEDGSLNFARGE